VVTSRTSVTVPVSGSWRARGIAAVVLMDISQAFRRSRRVETKMKRVATRQSRDSRVAIAAPYP
jgi:hypothetical protein